MKVIKFVGAGNFYLTRAGNIGAGGDTITHHPSVGGEAELGVQVEPRECGQSSHVITILSLTLQPTTKYNQDELCINEPII